MRSQRPPVLYALLMPAMVWGKPLLHSASSLVLARLHQDGLVLRRAPFCKCGGSQLFGLAGLGGRRRELLVPSSVPALAFQMNFGMDLSADKLVRHCARRRGGGVRGGVQVIRLSIAVLLRVVLPSLFVRFCSP